MRGLFFSQINTQKTEQGAVLKVFDEIRAFERAGFEMKHVNFPPDAAGLRKTRLGKGISAALPFAYVFSKYDYDPSFNGYDFYYFRFEAADYWLTHFLKQLRKHNPDSRILIEFPDYPNTAWMDSPFFFPIFLKDLAARHKYKKYVDRFVVLNPVYKEIYGVPTVTYMNGIDVSRVPVRQPDCDKTDRIDVIGIGTMFPVHGYERFIRSMASYYEQGGDRNITFHIVGDGPGKELQHYIRVADETDMTERVVFEGKMTGEKLSACFNHCRLAVEQLALYRRNGLQLSSSLKSREYLARGLPIVSGCDIDILLDKDFPYWLRFDNDDSAIDMKQIISFYDSVYSNETETQVIGEIRKFAENNCAYTSTLSRIFEYIRETDRIG